MKEEEGGCRYPGKAAHGSVELDSELGPEGHGLRDPLKEIPFWIAEEIKAANSHQCDNEDR